MLAEARKLMTICQTAVPVWIMPLSSVVQNFDPSHNHFDVVIIDEASQADIKALAVIYMGKQVVVVGDHEQVTPVAVGQDINAIQNLIDQHLKGIPLAQMYDGKLSIYDLAQTVFKPVSLREHFRCVSPIIQFSNDLSYEGKIRPLRDDSEVLLYPPLIAYHVKSVEARGDHVNESEARAITSLLVAATQQPEYSDATFGIISMVDDQQAIHIDAMLRRYLSVTEYTKRRILCGNPAQFQGDERDVVFLSMIDTPKEARLLTLRGEDAQESMYKKRFNVAASRARDQMWIVHSLDPDSDLKNGDIRKRLIQHAENPNALMSLLKVQALRPLSEFEKLVLEELNQKGYRATPQWPIGTFRIDIVVEGAGKRLALECDGDRWHPLDKLKEDMARQAILERLGWRFVRISGSQFFLNPKQTMEMVFTRLRTLNIPPEGMNNTKVADNQKNQELKDRIMKQAEELREQWATIKK